MMIRIFRTIMRIAGRHLLAWLALGLFLAACAGQSKPAAESDGVAPAGNDATEPPPSPVLPTATPAASPVPSLAESLEDLGPAPDITNQVWLNSDEPLTLAALRGKVVLLEFWTFG